MSYYKSASEIQEELLSYMPDTYNKVKGSWLWDILKAYACSLSDLTSELDNVANKLYLKNLQGDELDDYVENWSNIERKKATQAVGYVTFYAKSGKNGTVPAGTYVSSTKTGKKYITTEDGVITNIGGYVTVPVVAEELGSGSNADAGDVNKIITSIEFLEKCENYNKISGGDDYESDASLKNRYITAMKKQANAGNMAFYEEAATSVEGVGNAYCIPVADGAGTATIYIANKNNELVTSDVLDKVQQIIDPNRNGDGAGLAPIGAKITVKSPTLQKIEVSCEIVLENNFTQDDVIDVIKSNINDYITRAFTAKIIRYNQIGKCILDADGVLDYNNLLVNNNTKDIDNSANAYIFTLSKLYLNEV